MNKYKVVMLVLVLIGSLNAQINWTQATANAGWSARQAHTSVVFDNKIWVIGGHDTSYSLRNDVWYSTDGINWTCATANAGWSARYRHTSVVFDNKIWVIGGCAGYGSFRNDVWYSTDGINWTCATDSAEWSGRAGHTSVVFDNKIWVIGGSENYSYKNDVWYSTGANAVEDDQSEFIADNFILNAQPNPVKTHTAIRYSLTANSNIKLSIYDISGKLVKTLVNEFNRSGVYSVKWNGENEHDQQVAEGVYFYTLQTDDYRATKKLILTR